ncbi:DUF4249 domain-containing protein [Flavobacterium sp. CYK-4]|uniref:DUF4249 family protein n=1 Tax=Flavobacterium lotistagni TaxID=2709660 RepID=UPI00140C8469|nr:DUF4249 family protein [Flavobacterium lotistagni]NHM06193.1 DUF4249 domain-containing protein [Flavobacterium lotistagni]
MKKYIAILPIFILAFLVQSCEEVIDVPLDTEAPRLVIDAGINWYKGTAGDQQKIKLTTTTGYYNTTVPVVSNATVYIKNSLNTTFDFIEIPGTGEYVCTNFIPQINETYTLTVISGGQTYTATETLKSVAPIQEVIQKNDGGILGEDIELRSTFNDPALEENYYMYRFKYSNRAKVDYYVDEDRFYNGNTFYSITDNDDLSAGDVVEITHYGISRSSYNYMNILLSVAGSNNGGPFQSPPATVRGNIVNQTNFDNYALGFFRLSEVDTQTYTIQ